MRSCYTSATWVAYIFSDENVAPLHEESGWGGSKWKGREPGWNKLIEKKRSEENRLKRIEGALTVNKDRPQTRGEFFSCSFSHIYLKQKRGLRETEGAQMEVGLVELRPPSSAENVEVRR